MNIRKHIADSIMSNLEKSFCGIENFNTNWGLKGHSVCRVIFIPDPKYSLDLSYSHTNIEPVLLSINASPGELKHIETYNELSIDEAIKQIYLWTERIEQELKSVVILSKNNIDGLILEIDAKIKKELSDPDEKFCLNEMQELKERLMSLSAVFVSLHEKGEITEQVLSHLKGYIECAEKDLDVYSKRIWYSIHMNKIFLKFEKSVALKKDQNIVSTVLENF